MTRLESKLRDALQRREPLLHREDLDAYRVFHGQADGIDGLFIDRLGPGAVMIRHLGKIIEKDDTPAAARIVLDLLSPLGVRAVYDKPYVADRSKLGGAFEAVLTDPTPAAGDPLPPTVSCIELGRRFEIHLYDGFSTGLFLDQRHSRQWVHDRAAPRPGLRLLNTFAYTCGFSVAAAIAGATTTSVDVSKRYLDWGARNFELSGVDPAAHRFARMDTFEFFEYARRKNLAYDLIILDPPTFASGDARRGVKPFSARRDYAALVERAWPLLEPGGVLYASTNCLELCEPGKLEAVIRAGVGGSVGVRFIDGPSRPTDHPGGRDMAAWRAIEKT